MKVTQFTPARLLGAVSVLGLAYAIWHINVERARLFERAGACRANLNLIDQYVAAWERKNGELSAGAVPIQLDFRAAGEMVPMQGAPRGLDKGFAIAVLSHDADAFHCPDANINERGEKHQYRWMLSADPLPELGGGSRGTICLMHGSEQPADRRAWHALVKGRQP